jgi:hypothetical protein
MYGRGFCFYVFVCVFPLVFLVFRVFWGLFVFCVALLAMGMTAVLVVAAAVMSAASHISKR